MAQLVEIKKVTVGPRDLDALVEMAPDAPLMTSEDIEATARVFHLMPEIADHVCMGDAGRRFRDSMGNTELAHLLEHMTVELLARTNIAGDITCGRTYPVPGNERAFDVVFPCPDDVLVTSALSSAVWIMEWAFTGGGEPEPDVDAIVDGIVNLVQSVSEPADGGDEAAEQGAAEDGAPDQHPVPDEATLAEEPVPPEGPAPARPGGVRVRGCHPLRPALPCRSAPQPDLRPGAAAPGCAALHPRRRNPCRVRPLDGLAIGPLSLAATRGVSRLISSPPGT